MRAVTIHRYGPPSVLSLAEVAAPEPGPKDVLIDIHASAITQGDRRMRSAEFGGILNVLGRLFFGIRRPRFRVPGSSFSGVVRAAGSEVTHWSPGQGVFGLTLHGAHADVLRMPAAGAFAALPEGVSPVDAASLAYGAATALYFLRDVARVREGDHVVIVGAAGGVGRSATQLATAIGARVTAVASPRSHALVERLGATTLLTKEEAIDAQSTARVDVVFDTSGCAAPRAWKQALGREGRFIATDITYARLQAMVLSTMGARPRVRLGMAPDRRDMLEDVATYVASGQLRPVVAATFPLEEVVAAHQCLDERGSEGDIVVVMR